MVSADLVAMKTVGTQRGRSTVVKLAHELVPSTCRGRDLRDGVNYRRGGSIIPKESRDDVAEVLASATTGAKIRRGTTDLAGSRLTLPLRNAVTLKSSWSDRVIGRDVKVANTGIVWLCACLDAKPMLVRIAADCRVASQGGGGGEREGEKDGYGENHSFG